MSQRITLGDVQIKCRFPVLILQQCCIYSKYGEHKQADIVCIVKENEAKAALANMKEDKLEITARQEGGKEEILFSGILYKAELKEEGRHVTLLMQAISHTWKMDTARKSRSFQMPPVSPYTSR